MPRVIAKAVLQGTEAPVFTMRMIDRKLRWQLLRRPPPFPFGLTDKIGMKRFAEQHGVRVAETVETLDASQVSANMLRDRMRHSWPSDFVLKPAHGYQNKQTFAVRGGVRDILRDKEFNLDAAATAIAQDDEFRTYLVEELLVDERDADSGVPASLPMDFKFWCFGSHVAHVTIMVNRWRQSASAYTVAVADCDAAYTPRPTWCAIPPDPESGDVQFVELPPRPHCWDDMVASARTLGEAVGAFTRIDFYATKRGAIFGEFQLLFDLVDWNANADAAIQRHWRGRDGGGEG